MSSNFPYPVFSELNFYAGVLVDDLYPYLDLSPREDAGSVSASNSHQLIDML
jgi:hypothetical protein